MPENATDQLRESPSTVRLTLMAYDLHELIPYLKLFPRSFLRMTYENSCWHALFGGERAELGSIVGMYRASYDHASHDHHLDVQPVAMSGFEAWSVPSPDSGRRPPEPQLPF